MLSLLALAATSWLGIALGEPYTAVHARMGDPLVAAKDPHLTKFVYLTEHENAFVTVLTERGRVSGVRLWSLPTATPKTADPFGIHLNQDVEALWLRRGKPSRVSSDADGPFDAYQNGDVLWLYHVNANQTVRTITVSATESAIEDLPEAALPQMHTGTSVDDAVVMDTASPDDAKRWEDMYLAIRPCANDGKWHEDKRVTQTANGGAYDAVTVTCSSDGAAQTLYFKNAGSSAPNAG
ncbi:MAG TPA: hypothetical protein VJP85_12720 [Candidatus Baltobacteraceae bacterium]|nr:hypothetical protein [Candidatus Baltobacteraceae bacterium]